MQVKVTFKLVTLFAALSLAGVANAQSSGGTEPVVGEKGTEEIVGEKGTEEIVGEKGTEEIVGEKGTEEVVGEKGTEEIVGEKGLVSEAVIGEKRTVSTTLQASPTAVRAMDPRLLDSRLTTAIRLKDGMLADDARKRLLKRYLSAASKLKVSVANGVVTVTPLPGNTLSRLKVTETLKGLPGAREIKILLP